MKAFVFSKYGMPDVLHLSEVDKPIPNEGEVLVKVHTSAINDYDWSAVRGKPIIYRLLFGFFKPKFPIPGMELSGVVEGLGPNANKFKIGEAVFGDTSESSFGTFAEFICLKEKALTLKPKSMTHTDAAAMSHAGMLAYQGLVEMGKLKEEMNILINGAGGGVGTLAFQIAKLYNAKVTAVDTGAKLETLKSLGFDEVLDYKKVDFTKNGEVYDLILDAKTTRWPWQHLKSLKPKGRYVSIGGFLDRILALVLASGIIRLFTKKSLLMVALKVNKDLEYTNKLYEKGKLKPLIDGPHPFEDFPNQLLRFGEGKHCGKIIVQVANN
ncbi:MAG: NAD(P)-dependent alcohol dehydrogenase [Flavobacteriales bacterium]|nr:NAD(P)-dependent alcohol dehydrogenase [Flavobacteriales bacterium]